MPVGNAEFDTLLSTTMRRYRPRLVDNVFTHRPLLDFLRRRDRMIFEDGGESIVVPLMYGQNSTAKSYSGYDQLDITPQEGISAALYPWKQYAVTIAISGIEEAKNAGSRTRVINLLEAKTMQAEQSAMEGINDMVHLNGTGNGGKDALGLEALVGDNVDGPAVVGGIDCTDAANVWWRSKRVAAGAAWDVDRWAKMFNDVSRGSDQPDFILTQQNIWEAYEASLAPQLRFSSNDEADGRFQNLLFKGRPVFYDQLLGNAPTTRTGVTYFLNTRYLGITAMSGHWFRPTPFVRPRDYDARWSNILSYFNMTISNRARQGFITGETVA